jgi:hypothetical protein
MIESTVFTPATDSKLVLSHIRPLLDDVVRAFNLAIPAASRFFSAEGEPVERTLFAGIVRWYVKRALRQYEVSDEADDRPLGYELDDVANIGLIINCDGFQIRILKARDSKVPVSNSTLRQEFYQHNLALQCEKLLEISASEVLNLVVLWETDYVSDVALSVACPKCEVNGNTEGRRRVECFWQEAITAPVAVLPTDMEFERLKVIDSELDEVTLLDEEQFEDSLVPAPQPKIALAAASKSRSRSDKGEGNS